MSEFCILCVVDYLRMLWKNGVGFIEEIVCDGGDGLDGFGWCLLIVDVGEFGGFFCFVGYQWIISVLEGGGMCLWVDGVEFVLLCVWQVFVFFGDSEVYCILFDGVICDFNLIYVFWCYCVCL